MEESSLHRSAVGEEEDWRQLLEDREIKERLMSVCCEPAAAISNLVVLPSHFTLEKNNDFRGFYFYSEGFIMDKPEDCL
jgi:hypothetical protein